MVFGILTLDFLLHCLQVVCSLQVGGGWLGGRVVGGRGFECECGCVGGWLPGCGVLLGCACVRVYMGVYACTGSLTSVLLFFSSEASRHCSRVEAGCS